MFRALFDELLESSLDRPPREQRLAAPDEVDLDGLVGLRAAAVLLTPPQNDADVVRSQLVRAGQVVGAKEEVAVRALQIADGIDGDAYPFDPTHGRSSGQRRRAEQSVTGVGRALTDVLVV